MAAEFAIAANIVGNLETKYASPYVNCFIRLGKIVEQFKNRQNQLELRKDRVKNDVDKALRQTEVIEKDVEDWLTRAEKELEEAQSLENEIEYLAFKKNAIKGKAEQLLLRIKEVKSILIIPDDVWEELDLKVIRIPFGDDHNGCKIFLTTCLKQVFTQMNCQKDVLLNILSEHEAWALFKDNVRLKDVTSLLHDVAKEVAEECKGLPLTIVIVGRALKTETLDGWEVVNQ
ncbi:hypothetical protein POUND7_007529 [Theobroma cacao]